ncbi:patatin-like protein [Sphingomonas sp. ID1715]|uniref:patatin-like protein n=1 Tax=Sphingomonas sp. ID1715 TaxID=1656898 RepID=UPI001489C9C7|nr:patatin-like protein [Sphingomonas sp. ID1715]NNM75372.1 patatin-like protein [Sphingomonas sp. ID1715]
MREKELRLALICYGGISLAVYMHGITKEIWRLARASRSFHDGRFCTGSQEVYRQLLDRVETHTGLRLSVFSDIIAGASAGGINGIFLAQAIATGQSLDPLTDLWLEEADVERLIDPEARATRLSKLWAIPLAMLADRGGEAMESVDPDTRAEVRRKLSGFVRSRWFEPPFGGEVFTGLLLDALDAMAASPAGPPLLPDEQPLDLFVTVTDFRGHPQRLRLNSPAEVAETEHRLIVGFSDRGGPERNLGVAAELAFAARATASFPGAFPPFTVAELDAVLKRRGVDWPERNAFLARALPRHAAAAMADKAVLIDGSVLSNAPFKPAMDALKNRSARRQIDRRFVYIDPKPGIRSIRVGGTGGSDAPGFFSTILGALAEIPREQPIRDNLEALQGRSERSERMRRVIDALKDEVDEAIVQLFGGSFFLDSPTPARIATWRSRAQTEAARRAGPAYAAYGHLKLSGIVEELAGLVRRLTPRGVGPTRTQAREAIWAELQRRGLDRVTARGGGATPPAIAFFREHDLGFRIRRLRFLARKLAMIQEGDARLAPACEAFERCIYAILALYLEREVAGFFSEDVCGLACGVKEDAGAVLDAIGVARDLRRIDDEADRMLSEALSELPRSEKREMLFAYLGFAFYDLTTLSIIGERDGEFEAVKVDRISPDDATTIRAGGAEATLKGIRFNSFGAFFSRGYRENDYLWGRLHGADRLIDIVLSTLPPHRTLPPGTAAELKRSLFHAILDEEAPRLLAVPGLVARLRAEIG